jgi:hypothetical protein
LDEVRSLPQLFANIMTTASENRKRGKSTLVIIDDLLSEIQSGLVGNEFTSMFIGGRHSYLTVWVLSQYMIKGEGGAG